MAKILKASCEEQGDGMTTFDKDGRMTSTHRFPPMSLSDRILVRRKHGQRVIDQTDPEYSAKVVEDLRSVGIAFVKFDGARHAMVSQRELDAIEQLRDGGGMTARPTSTGVTWSGDSEGTRFTTNTGTGSKTAYLSGGYIMDPKKGLDHSELDEVEQSLIAEAVIDTWQRYLEELQRDE